MNTPTYNEHKKTTKELIQGHYPSFSEKRRKLRRLWNEVYSSTDWHLFLLVAALEQETGVSIHENIL